MKIKFSCHPASMILLTTETECERVVMEVMMSVYNSGLQRRPHWVSFEKREDGEFVMMVTGYVRAGDKVNINPD